MQQIRNFIEFPLNILHFKSTVCLKQHSAGKGPFLPDF